MLLPFFYTEAVSRNSPIYLVGMMGGAFEDVHWADPSTRELLGRLVEEMEGEAVLLIATTRPGFEAQWTNLAHVQVQSLSRLGLQDGAQLARAIAAELTATADDFVQTVLSRAEGNPLFIEELTRTVVQSAKSLNTQHIVPATPVFLPA